MQAGRSPMTLVGYARVSTEDQATARQLDELRAAGCREVAEEHASGGDRDRPVLARTLAGLRKGDTLVVARIDRLARSLFHLLEVIDGLERRGIAFKSLGDPIDTTSPQGRFALQVLGAAAELERALIRERSIAGLRAAVARGKGLPSDWGCGNGWGMTGRVFGWLGNKNGMGFAPGGNRGRGFGPKRRRDDD